MTEADNIWETYGGRRTLVRHMKTKHLQNTIAFLEREVASGKPVRPQYARMREEIARRGK